MASKGKQQEEGGAASSEAMDEDGSAAADRQVGEGEAGDETAADYYFDSYAHYGAFALRLLLPPPPSFFFVAPSPQTFPPFRAGRRPFPPHLHHLQASTRKCSRTRCAPSPTCRPS